MRSIDDRFVEGYGWQDDDEEGEGITSHWTSIVNQCEGYLERKLTPEEITTISLSVEFGPAPILANDDERRVIFSQVRAYRKRFGTNGAISLAPVDVRHILSGNGIYI